MRASYGILSLGVLATMGVACSGPGSAAQPPPSSWPSASVGSAATPAVMPERDMIVLMREQFTALDPSRAASAVRASAIKASHAHLVSELQATKAREVRSFELINGFATRMSQSEIDTMSAKGEVLAVVPDRALPAVKRPARVRGARTASTATTPVPSDGSYALCNTLEPEALQLMNAAFLDPTVPQAQSVLDGNGQPITGHGVTVGFIADGIDTTIPGFTRADGSKVFVDYQDFSGDPATLTTGGSEAFGDASSIAAQDVGPDGPVAYDISAYGYAGAVPSPCNVRIRGVAPGASLVGLKSIASDGYATESALVQAVSWAVVHDHVDVLNESIVGQSLPDLATDPFSLANAAAVRAGVTVTVSSGDAGSTDTLASPGTDPSVIDVGATTQLRSYVQAGISFGGAGWLDDNVAGFSSAGFAQGHLPRTIDLVAPGDSGWAYCSPNSVMFTECVSYFGGPTPVQLFGGTSESAPLTAGAAALVIQAYRSTHVGASPSPALVKSILMSTAHDTGAPADQQGAGIVDAFAAVNTALSVRDADGAPASLRGGPLVAPSAVPLTAEPGQAFEQTFQITNTGATALRLQPALQQLGSPFAGDTQTVAFDDTKAYYTVQTIDVPAGADHLDVSLGYLVPQPPAQVSVGVQILDPQNRVVVDSDPQGSNSGYSNAGVNAPAAGTWTAVIYGGGYTGPVQLTWAAEKYVPFGSVSPSELTVGPGATAFLTATFHAPSQPGDQAAALRFPGAALAEVPITVRTLVPLDARGGTFTGTLTGGNARAGDSPVQTYDFDVPSGVQSLGLSVTLPEDGYYVGAYLIDPNGMVLDSASNEGTVGPDDAGAYVQEGLTSLQLQRLAPQAGRWSLELLENQAAGDRTSVTFSARIAFDGAQVSAPSLPDGPHARVSASAGKTVTVSVTNGGLVNETYFVDARLPTLTPLSLPTTYCDPAVTTLPGTCSVVLVPTQTSAIVIESQSTAPITMDALSEVGQSPDLFAVPVGANTVAAVLAVPEVPYNAWLIAPALVGPFPATGAPTTPVTTTVTAVTKPYDPAVTSSTGDFWESAESGDSFAGYQPLVLAPGATGQITVTIQPAASSVGQVVYGTLYVDTYNEADPFAIGDEVAALPYAYTVAK